MDDGPDEDSSSEPPQRLSRLLRHFEPAVGTSIAAVTAWLAATGNADEPVLWMFVLYSLGVAGWAWLRKPVVQVDMAVRALVLLAGAYVLQTSTGIPLVGTSVFFCWVGVTALAYAFLLKPSWGSLVAGAAGVLLMVAFLSGGKETIESMAVGGAFLLLLPVLLAMRLGAVTRRPVEREEIKRIDSSTSLYNQEGLLAHGRVLLEDCRRDKRELTLAVFDCTDLLEVRQIYGNRTSRKLIACIIAKLTHLAGDRGLAARTGPAQFAVAMPMSREKAVLVITRVLGNPSRFELEGSRSEIVLVPNLMVETVADGASLERLFAALCRGLARLRDQEQMRERYLQRERERHSKPMSLRQPLAVEPDSVPARLLPRLGPDPVVQQIPTIPLPLAR